jgi:hypothetical protein
MRVSSVAVAMLVAGALPALAQQSFSYDSMAPMATPAAAKGSARPSAAVESALPVRAVSLYKNGVGFFEQAGKVRGDQVVSLDFTTAQLNDVLQSLTAVDLGGGIISRGGYDSAIPLAAQLNALFPDLGQDPTVMDLYRAIKGQKVEVHAGAVVFAGRVLNVEVRREPQGGSANPVLVERRYLSVVNDAGAVRTFELKPTVEVKLAGGQGREIGRYLQLLASSHEAVVRHLTLEDRGTGERELHLSYLSAVPAWKSSYRILFSGNAAGPKQTATLQGWAVVDNTSGADWKDVQLTLVSGAPQSFIQQISRPLVVPRQEIGMPIPGAPMPKLAVKSVMSPLADPFGAGEGAVVPMASQAGGMGGGVEVHRAAAAAVPAAQTPLQPVSLTTGYEAAVTRSTLPQTTSVGLDDLFEYKLSRPITIRRIESATVPILQTELAAERVTVWSGHEDQGAHAERPMRALWLTNTSDLTLDSGSFSVVEDGMFGGQGQMELVHPKERRLVPYAVDEAVTVDFKNVKPPAAQAAHLVAKDGTLSIHRWYLRVREYTIRNAGASPRTVVLEPVKTDHFQMEPGRPRIAANWELAHDMPAPAEVTDKLYRFEVQVAPSAASDFKLVERHAHPVKYDLTTMHEDELRDLVKEVKGSAEAVATLQPLLDAMHQRSQLNERLKANLKATGDVATEERRIRENMAALKGSEDHGLAKRYSDEMQEQEDKLAALHTERATLEQQHDASQKTVAEMARALRMDVELPQRDQLASLQ